ncbi:MAG: anti-sigma factor family protein [Xanthobacteraceae bacterium]
MRCEQAREQIGILVDGELAAGERTILMGHAAECADCAAYRDDLLRLRRHLREARNTAPARLAARISAALAVEATEEESAQPAGFNMRALGALFAQGLTPYMRQAAVLLVACAVAIGGTAWWMQRANSELALSRDVLAAHVRSLIQDNPVQIASLDTHTVKPWFAGRLDYSPPVKDLSSDGFQLVGGRLDYVDSQRVATLVYKRRLHQISVFVWPAAVRPIASYSWKRDGFNLLGWTQGGMSYLAVSDLNEGELRELQALL